MAQTATLHTSTEYDERLEVLRRRYREAREAGLDTLAAKVFAHSGTDVGLLRKLVAQGCDPVTIARIVI